MVPTFGPDTDNAFVPADARDAAVGTARTRAKRDMLDVEVLTSLGEVLEFVDQALGERHGGESPFFDSPGREGGHVEISFHVLADTDGIGLSEFTTPLVDRDADVEILDVARTGKVVSTGIVSLSGRETFRDEDQAVIAGQISRNADTDGIEGETVVLLVEVDPGLQGDFIGIKHMRRSQRKPPCEMHPRRSGDGYPRLR